MLDTQIIKTEVKIEDIIKEEIEIKQEEEEEDGDAHEESDKVHVCPFPNCMQAFNRPRRLQSHICRHNGQRSHPCQVLGCNKAYFNSTHLRRHMLTSHRPVTLQKCLCPHPGCNMQLSNTQNLKRHYYRVHEPRHPFKCEFCGKGFTSESLWQSHTYKHSGIDCDVCRQSFASRRDLNRHRRTNCRVFTCDVAACGQTFQRRTEFRKHLTLLHRKEHTCGECGKKFQQNCRLQAHLSVHQDHSQREVLTCPYDGCVRSYFHRRNLTCHVLSAHKERRRQNRTRRGKERQLQEKTGGDGDEQQADGLKHIKQETDVG